MNPSLVAKAVEALQRFDRWMWPRHRLVLGPKVQSLLRDSKVIVVDVGAASGPEERWRLLGSGVHFLTFEPLARPETTDLPKTQTSFPIGLGAQKGRGVLTVMRDPDASTLRQVNHSIVDAYPVGDGLQAVSTLEIDLDSLDHCLETRPDLSPDFLKIDVEGADLEVVRGAGAAMSGTVLGIRIEVSFLERHQGAPFFGETDAELRQKGFQLFQLSREQWVRRNLVFGYSSEPQLAWGDAVYFLCPESFLERLAARAERARQGLLAKMTAILLVHGAHDYAVELVDTAAERKLVTAEWASELRAGILKSVDGSGLFVLKSFAGVVFAVGIYLLAFPLKSARQRATFYVQQRAGHFSKILLRIAGRTGPGKSCISD